MVADVDDATPGEAGTGYVRTTVALREDLYQRLKRSDKGLSGALNEILSQAMARDHSGFGRFKFGSRHDLRDHADRV